MLEGARSARFARAHRRCPSETASRQPYRRGVTTARLSSLADSHPSDPKLGAAAAGLQELELGVLDYGQSLVQVAFDKQLTGLLHQAEKEIATGKADAKRALVLLDH
jgi:hypothetical protein